MVTFKFIKNPEYLSVGSRMVFREGRTKAVGTVTKVYPFTPPLSKQVRPKQLKHRGKLFIIFTKSSVELFSFMIINDLHIVENSVKSTLQNYTSNPYFSMNILQRIGTIKKHFTVMLEKIKK